MKKKMNKLRLLSLSVLLTCTASLVTYVSAQESTEESVSESESSQTQTSKKAQAKKPKSTDKVFKPSEEISVDSPVPFPVDI